MCPMVSTTAAAATPSSSARNRLRRALHGFGVAALAAASLLAADVGRTARADLATLVAVRDTTLFEDAEGDLGGGQTIRLFAGRTGQASDYVRRALLAFDFSTLPQGAVIQ
ncbi:MAG TPA: hypothetical protein VM490_22265, partial [Armatimonadaceae bacterium]|nr:hypothetical protein [Armatimonadaceae bacterium]